MEYSLEQLKVMAYDTLAELERLNRQLKEINAMIANYKEPKEAKIINKKKNEA